MRETHLRQGRQTVKLGLIKVIHDLFPDERLKTSYSILEGVYCNLVGSTQSTREVRLIDTRGQAGVVGVGHLDRGRHEGLEVGLERWEPGDGERPGRGAVIRGHARNHLVLGRFPDRLEVGLGQLPRTLHRLAAPRGEEDAIDPAARYRLDPEHGPRRVLSERAGERRELATGRALLALASDAQPVSADLASLRLPLRAVLLHHLGGRGLKSWEMLSALGRLTNGPLHGS